MTMFIISTLGHIGFSVPDVEKTCERLEKLGVTFVKKPNDGELVLLNFHYLSVTTWTWPLETQLTNQRMVTFFGKQTNDVEEYKNSCTRN